MQKQRVQKQFQIQEQVEETKRRLAVMRSKALLGLASLTVAVAAIAFLAYAGVITCPGGTCVGTNQSDLINGTTNADTIYALGGHDTILDGGGANGDTIFAGAGNDTIQIAATGAATAFGESGNDVFSISGAASHTLDGGPGNDSFIITANPTENTTLTITDGRGRDSVNVLSSSTFLLVTVMLSNDNEADIIRTGAGSDTIILSPASGRDFIDCGGGTDVVYLNGNYRAMGKKDGVLVNLRQVALLGGGTDTCETIFP